MVSYHYPPLFIFSPLLHSFYTTMPKTLILILLILHQTKHALASCTCQTTTLHHDQTHHQALGLKLVAIASILASSALGVCFPILLSSFRKSAPTHGTDIFFLFKAFAAGVILATGFIHILPDAFESLTSPCLAGISPWGGGFPFAGMISMASAMATFMLEAFATAYRRRVEMAKAQPLDLGVGDEDDGGADRTVGIILQRSDSTDRIRQRLISQVLELGILVHSVIIGLSLGTSQSTKTIKPLVAALSFHQFFEGMGLGGCISQAQFKAREATVMVVFFSLTTPTSIAIGIAISKGYEQNNANALALQGALNAASAGILIYMALVDILATDLMNPKLQNNLKLLLGANISLLLGAFCMAMLAKLSGT